MVDDPLARRARRDGPRLALVDRGSGRRLSWSELDREAAGWAARLSAEGTQAGDRIALLEPSGADFAAAFWGCLRLGAAAVPLSTRATASEIDLVLEDCHPRALVQRRELSRLANAVRGDPGDVCVLYTSGTTGPAKGVRLTLSNQVASAAGCRQSLGDEARDSWLLTLSPHHVGGLAILMRSVLSGRPVISLPRFEEGAAIDALRQERPTLVSLVPVMLTRILEAGGLEALRGLRAILLGGAPASASDIAQWTRAGIPVRPTYGLTETSSQVATVPAGLKPLGVARAGAGLPHSQATVTIEQGEIVVAGPVVSPGYLDPTLAQTTAGELRTGDLGYLDDQGMLHVTGRADDAIITGGENVQPEEVEAVLLAHPAVRDAAVLGRPDQRWGQVLEALVVAEPGTEPEALREWCRKKLSGFKVPRRVSLVSSLPRTEGGKLLRRELGVPRS